MAYVLAVGVWQSKAAEWGTHRQRGERGNGQSDPMVAQIHRMDPERLVAHTTRF